MVAADQIAVNVNDIRAVRDTCTICDEDQLFVAASMGCMHKPQICNSCMSRCVDEAFTNTLCGGVQAIQCPICKVRSGVFFVVVCAPIANTR